MFHQLTDLGGVYLYIRDVPPSYPVAQLFLAKSYLPKQNWADSGTPKIKVNPTKVCELMEHPVDTIDDSHGVVCSHHFLPLYLT